MIQVEMNILCLNIGANNGIEKIILFCFLLVIHLPITEKLLFSTKVYVVRCIHNTSFLNGMRTDTTHLEKFSCLSY